MHEDLKNLQPFRALDGAALDIVARHAHRLRLPEQRWLSRRGQPPSQELFLMQGVVAIRGPSGVERLTPRAAAGQSLNARAPGAAEMTTVTAVELIAVDLEPIRFLLESKRDVAPAVAGVDGWMHALLQGPVLRWFSPGTWARLLRTGEVRAVRSGERIVAAGEVCQQVFVVAEGVAASPALRYGVGDFFDEESTLAQQPAQEDVIMESAGTLVAFARTDILAMAADYDAPRTDPPPRRLDLDLVPAAGEEATLAALDPVPPIAVRGSDPVRRLTVAAKLMRRGFTVV